VKTPGIYYIALAAFCVTALCIGFASAADTKVAHTGTHARGNGHMTFDLNNATFQQQIITRYEQQGVDLTALQLRSGMAIPPQ
jgi:hypothetical protein